MDIVKPNARPRSTRRRIVLIGAAVAISAGAVLATVGLKPAAPEVERSAIWTDSVKRGALLRQVRGIGTLTPTREATRQIPAEVAATVRQVLLLPGSTVSADSVLAELTDPEVEQAVMDTQLQLKAAEADLASLRIKLESDLLTQKAGTQTLEAEARIAMRLADAERKVFERGAESALAADTAKDRAEDATLRLELARQRLVIAQQAIRPQIAAQEAKVNALRSVAALKAARLRKLTVRAGIDGVLMDLPLQVGQRVTPGTMLAKVVQPDHLMAVIKIPESQARDVRVGQPVSIDTHNGIVAGQVIRVDPAVQNGTVTIDVKLTEKLPEGARPDLSVDGTINLERLANVLYVGRPAFGQEASTITLFKLNERGTTAERVKVTTGKASANEIQILSGLSVGDTVILSDVSRWDSTDRLQIR